MGLLFALPVMPRFPWKPVQLRPPFVLKCMSGAVCIPGRDGSSGTCHIYKSSNGCDCHMDQDAGWGIRPPLIFGVDNADQNP